MRVLLTEEEKTARKTAYRAAHREEARAYSRTYYSKPENKEAMKVYHRMYHYGLGNEAYEAMLEGQGGKCAACGSEEKLVVDHDHETGVIRGLLCTLCNVAAGALGDEPKRAFALGDYLSKWK